MAEPTSCCAVPGGYCARVDILFNLAGVHVLDVARLEAGGRLPARLRLVVETGPGGVGCPSCGVIAEARGRRLRRLYDIPAFADPASTGTPSGRRSSHCSTSWPTIGPGWPGSTRSESTSTSGTTSPGPGKDRRNRPASWT